MSNNLDYLNFIQSSNNTSSSNSSYTTSSSKHPINTSSRINKIKQNFKPELKSFKEEFTSLLQKDYEQPFSQELEEIKRKRGEQEYKQDIKKIFERLGKMREISEETILNVQRYLDYVEVKKENQKTRIYLPGLEEKKQLDVIKLPDLLGFTTSQAKAEQYSSFILSMCQTFLGFPGKTLTNAIDTLYSLLTDNITDGFLCNKFAENSDLWPLYKINAYYNLINMLENGTFDVNKFIKIKKDKKDKKDKKNESQFGGKKKRKKGKKKDKRRDLFRNYSDNKKSDEISKKINYILKKEKSAFTKNKNNSKQNITEETLKEKLKKNGYNIFKNRINNIFQIDNKNDCDFSELLDKYDLTTFKEKSKNCNLNVKNTDDKLYNFGLESITKDFVEIVDFYTNKKKIINIKKIKDSGVDDIKCLFNLNSAYQRYYKSYKFQYLPLEEDNGLLLEKTTVLILNGLAIYLTTLRDLIILLEKKLMSNSSIINIKKEEEEMQKREKEREEGFKREKERFYEYRAILRELDKQIAIEKNKNKRNKLLKLKERALGKNTQNT